MIELLLAALLTSTMPAAAADLVVRSGPARTRLVELYSSEGCSSCPPADEWISSLAKSSGAWKDFVPVVFHVTYWDYLGWGDPFADPSFDARQRAYAASWGSRGTYTPGMVLDGDEWRGWGGGPPGPGGAVGTLWTRLRSGNMEVRFSPVADAGAYDVYVARLGFGLVSDVSAGENAGRRLRHDFVVRGLARKAMRARDGGWSAQLPLPRGAGPVPTREGLAVWVVDSAGRPAQAAGTLIP